MLRNANPKNKENKTTKKNGHKEQRDEAQGPCQKDSIRLSLLHPKLLGSKELGTNVLELHNVYVGKP